VNKKYISYTTERWGRV